MTLRGLTDDKQIGIHHDYHYRLDLFSELALRSSSVTTSLINRARCPSGSQSSNDGGIINICSG